MKNKKSKLLSTCCKSLIKYSAPQPDFIGDKKPIIGTCYCICSKCGKPCNVMLNNRKVWAINPKTRIEPDKRDQENTKRIEKEIKEN